MAEYNPKKTMYDGTKGPKGPGCPLCGSTEVHYCRGREDRNPYNPYQSTVEKNIKKEIETLKPAGIENWSVGFDNFWTLLDRLSRQNKYSNYPPYNIIKHNFDKYSIEVAVAGFAREEIDIEKEGNTLSIRGLKDAVKNETYLHQGIAGRTFRLEFALAMYVNVVNAELVDGILRIDLEREIPEEMRPLKIAIN